jgi:hypothetical protein
MRFSKGNWGFQSNLSHIHMTNEYPAGFESKNFAGKDWSGALALIRALPMGNSLRSGVMDSWAPLFNEDKSLTKPAIQMKIGSELGRLISYEQPQIKNPLIVKLMGF